MSLSGKQRRQLAARGHNLKPCLVLAEREVSETAVQHVREAFAHADLIKVRVNTRQRDVCAAVLEQVAARVPCEIVQRIGRVGLLYRPLPNGTGARRDPPPRSDATD